MHFYIDNTRPISPLEVNTILFTHVRKCKLLASNFK